MTQQTEVFSREHGPPVAAQAEKEAAFHPTAEWRQVEREAGFQALVEAKRKFIIPATVFFIAYYFALPILVGYFPTLMEINVIGQINLAYFFALSQFFMAWILMYMYIQKARKFDEMARAVTQKISNTQPLISPPVQASSPIPQPTLAPSSVKGAESNWEKIEGEADFGALVEAKKAFILPATIFFIVYYFALPVLVGYFPTFMETNIVGQINLAYFFALSQFFMAWILMYMYIQKARGFDEMARNIVLKIKGGTTSPGSKPTTAPPPASPPVAATTSPQTPVAQGAATLPLKAGEEDKPIWEKVEATAEFRMLIAAKKDFILPATIFFIVYYFALPVLVGYFPTFMETNIIGQINLAYFFALSQFFMAWILMYMYIQQARVFDRMASKIIQKLKGGQAAVSSPAPRPTSAPPPPAALPTQPPVASEVAAAPSAQGAVGGEDKLIWEKVEATAEFRMLIAAKKGFILPATIFFIVYYFALPVLVGYFPTFMETNIIGQINLAYFFALSQFFMAWILMYMYIQQARVFDQMAQRITQKIKQGSGR